AFVTFSANVRSPRLMSAIFPFTDAGKSLAPPVAQKTYGPLNAMVGENSSGSERKDAESAGVTEPNVSPLPMGNVDSTSTPGAASITWGPMFENVATFDALSTAATAMTPSYAAG